MALGFHGLSGEIFAIFIVNVLLFILTVGFYRFWGKTRMRRYLWSHFSVGGEGLEYSGTGKELFIGFLIVVFAVLLPLFGGLGTWRAYLQITAPEWVFLPEVIQTVAVAFLIPVALFRARRYRLSRTQWRGIRGGQGGSAWIYGGMSLPFYVLSGLTLGLAWPYFSVRLTTYKMRNTWFGDRQVAFAARAAPLYPPFLKVWGIYLGLFALFMVAMGLFGTIGEVGIEEIGAAPAAGGFDEMDGFSVWSWLIVLVLPLLFFALRIPWLWYRAAETRYFAGQTRYGNLRFAARVSGWQMNKLMLGNLFITIATLGLGLPITYRRIGSFLADRFSVHGEEDLAAILQSAAERPRTGEGLADAFDIGDF